MSSHLSARDIHRFEEKIRKEFESHVLPEADISVNRQQMLGKGASGAVYTGLLHRPPLALSSQTPGPALTGSTVVAVKQIPLDTRLTSPDLDLISSEIGLLSRLQHPHLVPFHGFCIAHPPAEMPVLQLVLRRMAYPFKQLMGPHSTPSTVRVRAYLQLAEAVEYLRCNRVTHRDIKPENILCDEEGNAFIADLGTGRQQHGTITYGVAGLDAIGTPGYMAPELALARDDADWQRRVELSFAVDMWSLGCAILAVETGVVPYAGLQPLEMLRRMERGVQLAREGRSDAAAAAELHEYLPYTQEAMDAVRPAGLAQLVHPSLPHAPNLTADLPMQVVNACLAFDPLRRQEPAMLAHDLRALLVQLPHVSPHETALLQQISAQRSDIVGLRQDVAGLRRDVASARHEREADTAALRQENASLRQSAAAEIAGVRQDLQATRKALESDTAALRGENVDLGKKLEVSATQVVTLHQEAKSAHLAVEAHRRECDEREARLRSENEVLSQKLKESAAREVKARLEAATTVAELKSLRAEREVAVSVLQQENETLRKSRDAVGGEIGLLRERLHSALTSAHATAAATSVTASADVARLLSELQTERATTVQKAVRTVVVRSSRVFLLRAVVCLASSPSSSGYIVQIDVCCIELTR
jgi:serine/threonine protein kinase